MTWRGFTIVELAIVLSVIGLLAGLAGSRYLQYIEKARVARAIAEISSFGSAIEAGRQFPLNSPPPDSLLDAGLGVPIDPWGTPYRYLRIEGVFDVTQRAPDPSSLPRVAAGPRPQPDQPRKDRFFKPISTDFDLYSSGPNGDSRDSLEHDDSRDDVVRALNGRFVGLAKNF
jgi:general secretion pathway protein G